MKQKTLKGSFSLFGKGLHTGLNLTVTFNPAPENTGYKIQRIDLEGQPIIDAIAENVMDTQRGTVLAKGDARVSTVEHGLAALYALGVDNCLIQVNGPEFPILDGSAIQYVEKINEVGIEELNAPKDWYIIRKKIEVKDEKTGSCITILPDDEFSLTAMCSFDSKIINSQFATVNKVEDFPGDANRGPGKIYTTEVHSRIMGKDFYAASIITFFTLPPSANQTAWAPTSPAVVTAPWNTAGWTSNWTQPTTSSWSSILTASHSPIPLRPRTAG